MPLIRLRARRPLSRKRTPQIPKFPKQSPPFGRGVQRCRGVRSTCIAESLLRRSLPAVYQRSFVLCAPRFLLRRPPREKRPEEERTVGAVRAALALLDPEEGIQSLRAESRQSLRQRGVEARKIDIAEAPQRQRNAVRIPPARPPPPHPHLSPPRRTFSLYPALCPSLRLPSFFRLPFSLLSALSRPRAAFPLCLALRLAQPAHSPPRRGTVADERMHDGEKGGAAHLEPSAPDAVGVATTRGAGDVGPSARFPRHAAGLAISDLTERPPWQVQCPASGAPPRTPCGGWWWGAGRVRERGRL